MDHSIRTLQTGCRTKVVWTRRAVLIIAAVTIVCKTAAQTTSTSPPVPSVQAIPNIGNPSATTGSTTTITATRKTVTTTVDGAQWLDSTVLVTGGEQLEFTATGTLSLSDGRTLTPAGFARGWKDLLRQFPLNSANTGALIGRVGSDASAIPFAIGATATATMPTTGHLFLRANLSDDLTATGTGFKVIIKPLAATATTSTIPTTPAVPIATLVSPATFAAIPRRVGDQSGDPGDMVNFSLLGTQAQIEAAFRNAGWVAVDKNTQTAVLHGLLSTLSHQAYVEMPMSTLFLFGRPQDLSFARADPLTVAAERHHLRIWKTDQTLAGRPLWVGSSTHDIGFERDQRNGGTTHKIDPDIDLERAFLLDSFNTAGDLSSAAYVTPTDPLLTARTATGGSFHSDGRIVVLDLKPTLQ